MKDALILNAIVLLVVLEADLGSHRKIGWFRILRPFVTSAVAVAIFAKAVTTAGAGLTLELALGAAGLAIGLAATALMGVYRSPRTLKPVSRAGFGYALLWIVVIGAPLVRAPAIGRQRDPNVAEFSRAEAKYAAADIRVGLRLAPSVVQPRHRGRG